MLGMDEQQPALWCHPCQTGDVEQTDVRLEGIGPGLWSTGGERAQQRVTSFHCNRCGRDQEVRG